ncbi:hypothetical protein GCM10011378_17980 [Hymenobacter glacieicola]|uniref:PKD domain-containing protein n=2 Tax=Hymenobacter glacieicola TaxID=1562124 RepID=A0ABQ1WUD0_9BACT|nr:hypothetical protein GCM10011378_17980 [Hymenobacter glacieicola]
MDTYEACASISDAAGNLLFYTSSVNVWNRNHTLMPNGQALGGHESASQGAAIVRHPANANQYYIFVVDACDNLLRGGLKYSIVDMSRQGGLGEVTTRAVQVPSGSVTEKLTIVPHANGTDSWILVHGWQSNRFLAFQLTANGLVTTPITSSVGSVHSGGGGNFQNANAVGYMKASPAGNKLAVGIRDGNFELFNFNNATGQVSNYVPLQQFYRSYGVEFSPDGSRLYGTNLDGHSLIQFNLLAGSGAAIAASGTVVGYTSGFAGALQVGPDGKIYVAQYQVRYLGVINTPNALGNACNFQTAGVNLGNQFCQIGLPNNYTLPVQPLVASFTSNTVCFGAVTPFTATISGGTGAATATWNFGDPASGTANTATGLTPTHSFSAPGTYSVVLTVAEPGIGQPLTITRSVVVAPVPTVNLGPTVQQVCQGQSVTLSVGTQPVGTTVRWQDGSTASTFIATTSGQYYVDVTNAQGCTVRASTAVQVVAPPTLALGPAVQRLCQGQSLTLSVGAQPAGTTYRWQDGSTAATLVVRSAGIYSVVVTLPPGCSAQASTQVEVAPVPTVNLGQDTTLCLQQPVLLRAGLQPVGSTYRWQDGSTAATYLASTAGTYSVEVTSPAGCVSRDERVLSSADCPFQIPNVITPNEDNYNEAFVLKGLNPKAWSLVLFNRWGRQVYQTASYDNTWNANGQPDGLYYYLLTNPTTGQQYRGWVQVSR